VEKLSHLTFGARQECGEDNEGDNNLYDAAIKLCLRCHLAEPVHGLSLLSAQGHCSCVVRQVDVPVLREQCGHFSTHLDDLYERSRKSRLSSKCEGGLNHVCRLIFCLSGLQHCLCLSCLSLLAKCVITIL
jgi:hypothetical protein